LPGLIDGDGVARVIAIAGTVITLHTSFDMPPLPYLMVTMSLLPFVPGE